MTNNKLTPQLIQEIYEETVSAECFETENVDACFDLLCKMDEAGGLSHVVRKLIDMVRAKDYELQKYQHEVPGGLFELQNIKSDARAVSTRLADALTRNSQQAIRIGIYERIYGPLRECPGEDSIYPAGQHTHGRKTFYCLSGHHHIGEYMFGPDEMASHTHSVTGGENDTDR